ncbi:MAG: type II toxin-antitoxin system VapC family toxin [Chloroflexota bacterium]|nr:type II toxin-antitoxin system VapC family toxin [Chloroflexota bacterium]
MSRSCVLDASALLALLNDEPGGEQVTAAIAAGALVGAVNFSEVVAKLDERGMSAETIREALDSLDLNVIDFGRELAYRTGLLRSATRRFGLSLGDRACLALAQHHQLTALTTDRAWNDLPGDVSVRLIR